MNYDDEEDEGEREDVSAQFANLINATVLDSKKASVHASVTEY